MPGTCGIRIRRSCRLATSAGCWTSSSTRSPITPSPARLRATSPRDRSPGPAATPWSCRAGGQSDRKTLVVKPDPRIRASEADLTTQIELATRLTDALALTYDSFLSLKELRASVAARVKALADSKAAKDVTDAVQAFDKKARSRADRNQRCARVGIVNRDLARYYSMLTSGDARPAERLRASIAESCEGLTRSLASGAT